MSTKEFMKIIASTFCGANEARPTLLRRVWAEKFQYAYMNIIEATTRLTESRRENVIGKVATRSAILNRSERITGDAICNVGDKILRTRKQMERRELFSVISGFIAEQVLVPEVKLKGLQRSTVAPKPSASAAKSNQSQDNDTSARKMTGRSESILKALGKVVRDMRHGL